MDLSVASVLVASIIINFAFVKIIEHLREKKHRKISMIVPVLINVCVLLYFKYTNFLILNINNFMGRDIPLKEIVLPLGISFFTFQQIAYVVSVYKGDVESTGVDYFLYILYFPKILMGPLVEPKEFLTQINDESLKKVNIENLLSGIQIFSFGLFKKVMLADVFAKGVSWGFGALDTASSTDLFLVMLFYTFEIYFDFSGYSDMAVGSSLMLNISLPINFDSPYKAISIRDFWKRWHMFYGRKESNHGQPSVFIYDCEGNVVASFEKNYRDLDNEWHQYVIELPKLKGPVTIILNGGYVDNTGSQDSLYDFGKVVLY